MASEAMDAESLTKHMDALLAAKDMEGLRAMYHPDIESVKPNGEIIQGIDANFGAFERLIANQFPEMTIDSFNFISEDENVCTFDTVTMCNNEAIVVDGVTKLAANATYNIRKENTFKDGLLIKVSMVGAATDVICKDGKIS
uniref:SnoaL-like domain-containing protein n=1 Tax=Octactis speculum TaxID=3111310 RepID=A0A7S2CYG6_9STRA|mmetsp:Transcript_4139/g.4844  ORF Transcript_4139/g.4844 Transcript_4139/m.4844 type:complete len:142 (+) Transcript_4139:69-494(+)|eukprot:CAMPEP_0185768074 /NCGR_PEP_ID=MMETSP1174-20130828/47259_1 /TAXON_ID=35687 /ORGANISM="Dictyocha speculum, Strain CCMP1381" /LENGTH=141 /DNA_ID=CAMNT_0028452587 /DNA_START=69 /DNA_END=494 /DNA_ORIENTATION=+